VSSLQQNLSVEELRQLAALSAKANERAAATLHRNHGDADAARRRALLERGSFALSGQSLDVMSRGSHRDSARSRRGGIIPSLTKIETRRRIEAVLGAVTRTCS
jgi:hypothetical protein